MVIKRYDLGRLKWTLAGFVPEYWKIRKCSEIGNCPDAEISPVKAKVPGSVQKTLLDAGIIPDWNIGINARECEWIENRHWIYETRIPDEWLDGGTSFRLKCLGLDYCGCIRLNNNEILSFANAYIPHAADLTKHLNKSGNILQIVFECPPRWLGQFGFTSRFTQWKPRFNYFWDWSVRMVQTGIWDDILLEIDFEKSLDVLKITTDANINTGKGILNINGTLPDNNDLNLDITLYDENMILRKTIISAKAFNANGIFWNDLDVSFWYPNGMGEQKLYRLLVLLKNPQGEIIDENEKRTGFKNIRWEKCKKSPENADPWLCVINGKPEFLFGVNWTPVKTNFADVSPDDYKKRLAAYKNMNMNIARVWGGAFLEKEIFYDICDELGILVWQEFPLSSSGLDNYPPDTTGKMEELASVAASFIRRRQHHVSLLLWSGGNELADDKNGTLKNSCASPVTAEHPLIKRFAEIVERDDHGRRFVPTSPSGPRAFATTEELGKGVHWDVHGPWKIESWITTPPGGKTDHKQQMDDYKYYWNNDDALFRSEVGVPGPASVDLIRKYKGNCKDFPATHDNPFWNRSPWWIEWDVFIKEKGKPPADLEEYVNWGQKRQTEALTLILRCELKRFPECGGVIIWMGHDCYPCNANTSILDFEGNPKPAALKLAELMTHHNKWIF